LRSVAISGNRIEGRRDVGCDRKDAERDRRTDETWGDEVYGILRSWVRRLLWWYRRERGTYTKKSEYRRNRQNKLKPIKGNIKGDFGPIQGTIRRQGKAKYEVSTGTVSMCNIIGNRLELSQGAKLK
jgi:hypothetical protein